MESFVFIAFFLLLLDLLDQSLFKQSETSLQASLSGFNTLDSVVGAREAVNIDVDAGVDGVVETEHDGEKAVGALHNGLLWVEMGLGGDDEYFDRRVVVLW
jgi:hypothetical protein